MLSGKPWHALLACSLVLPGGVHADTACPRSIVVQQAALHAPPGWELVPGIGDVRLRSVRFFDGHPSEEASLIPPGEGNTGPTVVVVWRAGTLGERSAGKETNAERGTWVSCYYTGTTVVLNKRLPARTKYCEAYYEKGRTASDPLVLLEVSCG